MIKPLLRTMPALSGNVKLGCEVSKYTQIDKDTFTGVVRTAHLYPLSSKSFQKTIEVSLLNSSWEFDLCKFYGVYNDTFYSDLFKYDKENPLHITDLNDIINDRNADFEYGCKRVSYQKSGYQLCFYAPIYCESVEDIPDYFEITVTLENTNVSKITKKIRIDLSNKISYNYLYLYLQRYFKQIDDSVVFMTPASNQAVYYGIDVLNGGFNEYVDNIISKVYIKETTINGFDAVLASGFKRNHLIMKQIMPLSFYFNISDILTEEEKLLYVNSKLHINGAYFKNNSKIAFYNFNDDYTYLNLPVLQMDSVTGNMTYVYNSNNILDLNNRYSLKEAKYIGYKFANKINKSYVRWKLKYSDDIHPYITNNNYSFSANQGLHNLYYQYPQNYFYSNLLCNVNNNEVNVLLPLGDNIQQYYSEYQYIVNKYNLSMNNYISNWFDTAYEKDIKNIINNTDWADVHPDGKIFYKGLLYNFNGIYTNEDITNPIDKFAILLYINDDNIISKQTENNFVFSKYSMTKNITPNVNSYLNFEGGYQLFDLESVSNTYNTFFDVNDYFSYNKNGEGKFVDLYEICSYIGTDIYDLNKYYDIEDIELSNSQYKHLNDNNRIIEGYEILPFSYISNITNKNGFIIDTADETLSYSYNSGVLKTPISYLNPETVSENRNSYILYKKHDFISLTSITAFNADVQQSDKITLSETLPKYSYIPKYKTDNNVIINGAFTYIDPHNMFYGNKVSFDKINVDNNVLYLDPYNIKDEMQKYYQLTGKFYILDISDKTVTLANITNNDEIVIFVSPEDKETILNLLDYKNTYIGLPEYNYSPYNVPKLITSLNNIILTFSESQDYSINSEDSQYIYYSTYTSFNIYGENVITNDVHVYKKYESDPYAIYGSHKLVCYNYSLSNTDVFDTNTFIDNPFNNTTYITGYMYVSNINDNDYSFTISDFSGKTFTYRCNNKTNFYNLGVKFDCMHFDETVQHYVNNQNCVGTYMYKDSFLFDNPQKIITQISNIPYITDTLKIQNSCVTVSYYDTTNNIYTYSNSAAPGYKYNGDIEKYQKFEGTQYSNTSYYIYNYAQTEEKTVFQNILYNTNTTIAPIMYGKFMNKYHIHMFKKELAQYAQNINGQLFNSDVESSIYNYIYVKKNYVVNNRIQEMFIPLNTIAVEELNGKMILDRISSSVNYEFTIDEFGDEIFELYFKKNFIKVSKPIYDNIIRINTSNYHDLYIYRLETDNDTHKSIKFINDITAYTSYELFETNSYSVVPLFNNVNEQYMEDTEIYSKYLLNQITPVEFSNSYFTYTFYRYNAPDKVLLYDVSNMYSSDKPNFIYNTVKAELQSYTYVSQINEREYTFLTNETSYYSYSYYSNKFATYDDYGDFNVSFNEISNIYDIDFDKYKLNTYTYNGTTYAFYFIEVNLSNISDVFNVMYLNFDYIKYFTQINGNSIINNHKYLTDMFPKLMPCMNYNILSQLYNMSTLHRQHKTLINKEYYNVCNNDYNSIEYSEDLNNTLTLYRYYDNIVPLITKMSNIHTEYALKSKVRKHINCTDVIYNINSANIYNYPGIRIYTDNDNYTIYKQPEYKYFNDNCFYNLELKFDIFIGDSLTYLEVLYYEQEETVKKYFDNHINKNRISKLSNTEILFLYNKYNITYEAYSIKLDNTTSEKLYSLTYKFTLK